MLVQSILKKLNIEYVEILPFQKGYRNRSYPILTKDRGFEIKNLIIYKNEPDILSKIKNADLVSNYLFGRDLPTRKSLSPIIKIKLKNSTRYSRLYNYLPGETISWEAYTKNHIKLLGKTMAIIHQRTRNDNLKTKNFPNVLDVMRFQVKEMKKYFSNRGVLDAMRRKLNLEINIDIFERFDVLTFELSKLPKDILHMDLVRSNILFSDAQDSNKSIQLKSGSQLHISGILDFEKVAVGPKIVDIARTLAFLIVDCKYKDEKKIRKYFLRSGYLKHGNSEIKDLQFLQNLLEYFWTYDLYKFLVHNPFEQLSTNAHYVKTYKNILSPDSGDGIILYEQKRRFKSI
jgi:Ser/Thr protein kinase RdoA (MazF antagonist)